MRTILTGLLLALAAACAWADAPKPVETTPDDALLAPFLKPGSFRKMTFSPDGNHIAALVSNGINNAVALIDTDTMKMRVIVQSMVVPAHVYVAHMANPIFVTWVANDILAVNYNDGSAWTFDIHGARGRDLFAGWRMGIRDSSGHNTDWMIVQRDIHKTEGLSRYNARTGENYSVDIDVKGKVIDWLADANGDIRMARTIDTAFWSDSTRLTTWYRDDAEGDWRNIDERSILDEVFQPLIIDSRPGHVVVQARNDTDRLAIWDFDVDKKTFGAQLAASPTEDIVAVQVGDDRSAFVDVVTDGLKPQRTWFDPRMAKLQASLDLTLPDRVNVMQAQHGNRLLVLSYSDVEPGHWYLFEPAVMKMKEVAVSLPDIEPEQMQPMRTLHYPSADGLSIPAYLTLPGKPAGPSPLIVLIHGGPQARDRWQWDRDVQVFASHGYAVFQPQFRGSTGFGKKFEAAGYGQWGQAMQDDITAGVHWLIDQKIADPARICIVGASYGGYAALWGLVKTPELYKCGVSTAGVSDLEHMLHDDSDTSQSAVQREYQRSRIGDPQLMKAAWSSVSPLKHADRIVAPLLIVHGDLDRRVPISHGKAMLAEMQRLHKDVQWLEFSDEGHGVSHIKNAEKWYAAMFALFERTIGKGVPPPNAARVSPAAAPASAASVAR